MLADRLVLLDCVRDCVVHFVVDCGAQRWLAYAIIIVVFTRCNVQTALL